MGVSWVPWGAILSTVGDVQYHGGYHDARGGYHEYRGGVQYRGGCHPLKFEYRGGYHDTCGGYHDTCGDIMSTLGVFSTMGYSNNKRFSPTVLNTLHGTHDIPHVHHDIPHGTRLATSLFPDNTKWIKLRLKMKNQEGEKLEVTWKGFPSSSNFSCLNFQFMSLGNMKRFPLPPIFLSPGFSSLNEVLFIWCCLEIDLWQVYHGTEHPPRYSRKPPTVLMISPTVLNTPTVLKISSHIYHDIPHGTEHPHGTQDIPPRYSWYPPRYWTPHSTEHPHGTEHPPRYCTHIIQGV